MVAPRRVRADGRYSTLAVRPKRLRAFVDIVTANASVARVPWRAGAGEAAQRVGAEGALSAQTRRSQQPIALVDVLAEPERIPGEAWRT